MAIARPHLSSAGPKHRLAQHRKGQFLHHHVGDVGTRDIHPFPEALQAQQHRPRAGLDLFQQRASAAGFPLAAHGDVVLAQRGLQRAEDLQHAHAGREEGQSVAAGEAIEPVKFLGHLVHEVLDLAGPGVVTHVAGHGEQGPAVVQFRWQGDGILRLYPIQESQSVQDEAEAGLPRGA